ncbi:hypothetical protein ACPSL3_11710 [Vibrio owensii]|uniref:hypothetical protein n=1 Tax=Vibrio owensii TaxID=696485 RepID=UPI003CE4D76F
MNTIDKLGVLEYSKRLMQYSLEAKITPLNVLYGNPLTKLEKMSKLLSEHLDSQPVNASHHWNDEDKAKSNLLITQTRIIELQLHTNNLILAASCTLIFCLVLLTFAM